MKNFLKLSLFLIFAGLFFSACKTETYVEDTEIIIDVDYFGGKTFYAAKTLSISDVLAILNLEENETNKAQYAKYVKSYRYAQISFNDGKAELVLYGAGENGENLTSKLDYSRDGKFVILKNSSTGESIKSTECNSGKFSLKLDDETYNFYLYDRNSNITSILNPEDFTIIFDGNGGFVTVGEEKQTQYTQTYKENSPVTLEENKFVNSGYKFAGWSCLKETSDVIYEDKYYLSSGFTEKEYTLYAVWKDNSKIKVSYHANNGTSANDFSTDYIKGEDGFAYFEVSENIFTRDNYIFAGWAKSNTGNVECYEKDFVSSDSNVDFYAFWIPESSVSYIILNSNYIKSGETENEKVTYVKIKGITMKIPKNKFSRENYTFAGWAAKSDSESALY